MYNKSRSFALALLALVLTLPLAARDRAVASGRQAATLPSLVSGIVSSVSGTTVSVANGLVTIDASAAVIATTGGPGTVSSIVRGARITATVNGDAAANATLRATHIIVFDEPELTLSGSVQSVDQANRSFQLLGRTIFVTDATSFAGSTRNASLTLADIAVNNHVVAGVNVLNGRLVAESIYTLPSLPSLPTLPAFDTFEGVVKSIDTAQWVVVRDTISVVVKINAQTIITGSPRPGDRVRVVTATDSSNSFTAVAITRIDVPTTSPRTLRWIHGTVLGTHSTSWTIQEKDKLIETSVEINSDTRIATGAQAGAVVDVLAEVRDNRLIALVITRSLLQR